MENSLKSEQERLKQDRREHSPLVLVVDDEPLMHRMVRLFLQQQQYQIEAASDGSEALEKIELLQPDVVLLNIIMPHVSGVEVLEQMASQPLTASIPVVIVTALDRTLLSLTQLQQPMYVDFLRKPFSPAALRARVVRALADGK